MSTRMKIVIGYDGLACANRALAYLRRAGLPPDTEAMIVSVAEVLLPPSAYGLLETTLDERVAARAGEMQIQAARPLPEALKIAIEGSERIQEIFPSWNVRVKFSSGSPANEEVVALARRHAETAAEELRAAGLYALSIVVAGDPRHVLINEARRCGADCIFVGASGLGRIERLLLGSVSSWVGVRVLCSVEVARAG